MDSVLQRCICLSFTASKHGLDDMPQDVINLISHATQERLRNIAAKLATVAEHRLEVYKVSHFIGFQPEIVVRKYVTIKVLRYSIPVTPIGYWTN